MEALKITEKSYPVTFTIRIDKNVADFYEMIAGETNRSRNEVIGIALEYAMNNINIEKKNFNT